MGASVVVDPAVDVGGVEITEDLEGASASSG